MKDRKKIVFYAACVFLIALIMLLLWQKYWQQKQINEHKNQYQNWSKPEQKLTRQYQFIFKNKEKILIQKQYQYFPEQINETRKDFQKFSNWNIGNYLNVFWPQWNEYYEIEVKTLQKKLQNKNIIHFIARERIKERFQRQKFNQTILNQLNINAKSLKVKKKLIEQLLAMIKNKTNKWKDIQIFLEQNCTVKENKIIQNKLKNSTWSFEWTDS